jgi:hypothetical protein
MSPFIYTLKCDGPECPREDYATFDPQRGWNAPGWKAYGQGCFCSHLCLARYAAALAEQEAATLQEAMANGHVDALHPSGESGAGEPA